MIRLARVLSFFKLCPRAAAPRSTGIANGVTSGVISTGYTASPIVDAVAASARSKEFVKEKKAYRWLHD